ncbi:MAG: helix-turn-helix domain-containing protein [Oscillospiraceae bacterium]|nr:helix-turn-helix domain-containing protein [Oscillospiraceae bacterium]
MADELLTVSQTAKYLKVSDKTVRRLIQSNQLIASKVGNSWRIDRNDISEYLKINANSAKRRMGNE